jgi:two-component system NtrC family response regulator
VDDDLAILRTFTRILERKGYLVTAAARGIDAKNKLANDHFDVALIDLRLPDMEGTELFPYIQQSSRKTIKIVITGQTQRLSSIKGADASVAKPVDPTRLLSIIDSKIKLKSLEP